MDKPKRDDLPTTRPRFGLRFWFNLTTSLHIAIYTLWWFGVLTMLGSADISLSVQPHPAFWMVLWTPVLFIHIAIYYYMTGKANNDADERAAYREGLRTGYRDAMQELIDSGQISAHSTRRATVSDARLRLDDEEAAEMIGTAATPQQNARRQ